MTELDGMQQDLLNTLSALNDVGYLHKQGIITGDV